MRDTNSGPSAGIKLENGLTVYFQDRSKPLAGDRWQVKLDIVIPIRILPEYFSECSDPTEAYAEAVAAFGEVVEFRQERVRHFVDERDRAAVREKMERDFRESVLAYASRPKFAESCVLKRYKAYNEKQGIRRAYVEALSNNRREDE
ncbi:MAG: hypothetical protein ABFD98_15040 [Syntrophobacteraceae bacterium]